MTCNAARSTTTLRQALAAAGVSQRTAGAAIGRSDAYINRRLSGEVPITLVDLEALAELAHLHVRLELVAVDAKAGE